MSFEPTLAPPTAQSLPPELPLLAAPEPPPVPVAPEPPPAPLQAPAPAVEAIAVAPEPPTAPPPAPATAPEKKGRAGALIAASRATPGRRALVAVGLTLVALVLLCGIGYAIYVRFYADPLADAVAGHCLAGLPAVEGDEVSVVSDARIVHCTDPDATYLVQGRLDDVTEEQAQDSLICRGFRHATEVYKAVPAGSTGYVLCLSRVGE